jgi:D-alanine--poly(phosphoribitol) ligase subunit 1
MYLLDRKQVLRIYSRFLDKNNHEKEGLIVKTLSILERLAQVVKKYPKRIAFADLNKNYTYIQLWQGISGVANKLNKEFSGKNPVLIYGANDFDMLVAMLGVNAAGQAYIPVDEHTPDSRVRLIIDSSKPVAIIVVSAKNMDDFNGKLFEGYPVFFLEDFDYQSELTTISLEEAVRGEDTNYLIYTSGTTGAPKGVEVSHQNLLSFTEWMLCDFKFIEENQVLLQAPFSFDLSIFSLYPALLSGGTLVSLSKEETSNFKKLFERLNTTEINTWISTPSFVDICLLDPSFTEKNHPKLEQFIFCGEELTVRVAGKLLEKFPNSVVWNTYGPTEATGAVTYVQVTADLLEEYQRLPIGKAKAGVEIRIHDPETKQPVSLGEQGEIVIVGDSVARGYYRNSEKTIEVFGVIDGKPAYYTGDAGRIDTTGQLLYQGRIDFQVKMNGYRIELQDIESHLSSFAAIEKAIVLPQMDYDQRVRSLIAVIVPKEEVNNEREFGKLIREGLKGKIMDYMMPARFILMEEFPLNKNGKVDRNVLTEKLIEQR